MTTKKSKKSSTKKALASKTKTKKVTAKKTTPKRPAAKTKKPAVKKNSTQHLEDVMTKQALKFIDEAASLLRSGIKSSQKNTSKARETAHKKAHSLLGKATRHLDDALKSGSSFLRQAINKL
jgi:hypothetical protein